jgi:hypothetical protein
MKINYKKSLKLVTLLAVSLLIASASATVYTTMYMKATPITIQASEVKFTTGNDTSSASGSINPSGTEVVFTGMTVAPNATRTYSQAVNVTDSGGDHNITLLTDSITGNLTGFKFINITIYNEAGVKQGDSIRISPTLSNVTSTTQLTIGASKTWSVEWIIVSIDSGAQEGSTVNAVLKMNVQ